MQNRTDILPTAQFADFRIYFEGDLYFEDVFKDLEAARHSIFIEMYILEADTVGQRLKEILIQKAKAGVLIKIIVDGIGSFNLPRSYTDELISAGVQLRWYHPVGLFSPFGHRINKRDHRKLVIVDQRIGFLGGMNLFDQLSLQYHGIKRWRDTHLRISNQDLVDKICYHFRRSNKELKHRSKHLEKFSLENDVIASGQFLGRNHIRRFLHRYIRKSVKSILISTAYFIPDLETIYLLVRAQKRGVTIKIITASPEASDVTQVQRIHRPLLKYLIKRQVEVYYYEQRMMHAKSIVFDERIVSVGSSNINYRSFFRDLEINVFLRRPTLARPFVKQFKQDLECCRRVTLEELNQRSLWDRFIDGVLYLIRSFF